MQGQIAPLVVVAAEGVASAATNDTTLLTVDESVVDDTPTRHIIVQICSARC
jgi:hypothetical protein